METGQIKTKLCTEGATHDQSKKESEFNPIKLSK